MTDAILEQTLNGLMMGSIYVLVALGMVLIYGVMQVVNFAHGVLFTAGGYLAHFFYTRVLDSYPLAILLSMASLAAIGLATARGRFWNSPRFGTATRATSQSREAAMVVGIPVERVHWSTFAIGTMLAAL